MPIVVEMLTSIIIVVIRAAYLNFRVLKPVKEITCSAKGIIVGNYDLEVIRTYEKIIGENEIRVKLT